MSKKTGNKNPVAKVVVASVGSGFTPGVFNSDVEALCEGKEYPFSVWVTNNTPTPIVEAELHAVMVPHGTVEVTVRDFAQLQRSASNFEQLCFINGWVDGVSISDTAPVADEEQAPDADPSSQDGNQAV